MSGFLTKIRSWVAPAPSALVDSDGAPYLPACGLSGFAAQLASTRGPTKVLANYDLPNARFDAHPFGPGWHWLCYYTPKISTAAKAEGFDFDLVSAPDAFEQWFMFHLQVDGARVEVFEAPGGHMMLDPSIKQVTVPDMDLVWSWDWDATLEEFLPPPSTLQKMLAPFSSKAPDPEEAARATRAIGVDKEGALTNRKVVKDIGCSLDVACVQSILMAAQASGGSP